MPKVREEFMNVSKVNNETTFKAKIVRNDLMNKAIDAAKTASESDKRAFYGALDFIHDDLLLKSVEIKKTLHKNGHLVKIVYPDNYIKTYHNIAKIADTEGSAAMKSLFNFIKEHYGTRILLAIQHLRIPEGQDVNNEIDNVLSRNASRYI